MCSQEIVAVVVTRDGHVPSPFTISLVKSKFENDFSDTNDPSIDRAHFDANQIQLHAGVCFSIIPFSNIVVIVVVCSVSRR